MKLIGSTTSPYTRKSRLLLKDQDYEFEYVKALSPEGGKKLESYGSVRRVPILIDQGKTIFDSSLICEYLLSKDNISLSIDEKLNLKLIDELCDAGIILFQQRFWDIDPQWQNPFCQRTLGRAQAILSDIDTKISTSSLTELERDWLFCVLDWMSFRQVISWQKENSHLDKFYQKALGEEKYKKTSPAI